MIKALVAFSVYLLALQCIAQVNRDLTLKTTDESGDVLVGAHAEIVFRTVTNPQQPFVGLTDDRGEFRARAEDVIDTRLRASLHGRYSALVRSDDYASTPAGEARISVVLPRVLRPTPLYAARVSLRLPIPNQWVGYDLQSADFVAPHGKGTTEDLRLRFQNEFLGWKYSDEEMVQSRRINKNRSEEEIRAYYGKWRGVLEVAFLGPKEGVVEERENYWYYSQLRLPHLAPEDGYRPSLRFEANTYERPQPEELVGYYLRTRVRLDAEGNIVSANYAKLYGDIHFDARGTVSFWYYFNPTPNDRNLEFDPQRNLFPASKKGSNVGNP